ncbi:glucose inhibited division protein a [Holotrichia oblita]|nr:glucose inhibited division protein a [Holotrichia oblita]
MKRILESIPNLIMKQSEAVDLKVEEGKICGVTTEHGETYAAKAVVLCMGTYLRARCLCGETINECGPGGMRNSKRLSESMSSLGIKMFRFKTGTPARIDGKTIDYSKMTEQKGDDPVVPFSFENEPKDISREQISCYLTYTNEKTHEIIKKNIHRSPIYGGVIEGTGTRYCPSIEDKVVRFSDKDKHQVFIEPEGEDTCEMYVAGMSTSLPEDVQTAMYRSVPGLENAEIMRNGYAIEYDCIDATQLKLSLEFRQIGGLFSAGQFNGSSGYEEAAAQGLIAGINAALYVKGRGAVDNRPFTGLHRSID